MFDVDAAYDVTFDSAATTARLHVRRGDVFLDLQSHDYDLLEMAEVALVVGELSSNAASLRLSDSGSLSASAAEVGYNGAPATLSLPGPASDLILALYMSVLQNGTVAGNGSITGEIFNYGSISPGEDTTGQLQIVGDYHQLGTGALDIEVSGTAPGSQYDVLDVNGEADLGGGLFVQLADGFEPQAGQTFDILNASSIIGSFDVAFMPGLTTEDFMRVDYGFPSPGSASATIIVESLASLFGFDDPESIGITGLPSDVAVGDFDNDNDDDLAITLFDTDSVLIVLSGIDQQTGDWIADGTTQHAVGNEPSGITAGFFDGDNHLDLAVANRAHNTVQVLLNDGLGTGGFNVQSALGVGNQPSDLAAGDLDALAGTDLVVANTGDNELRILSGDGSGSFTPAEMIAGGLFPVAVDTGDLDNDKGQQRGISPVLPCLPSCTRNRDSSPFLGCESTVGSPWPRVRQRSAFGGCHGVCAMCARGASPWNASLSHSHPTVFRAPTNPKA